MDAATNVQNMKNWMILGTGSACKRFEDIMRRIALCRRVSAAETTQFLSPAQIASADFAQDAVVGDSFPHGFRRSSHWRKWYGEAWLGVNLSVSHGAPRCYTVPSLLGVVQPFFHQ